MSRELQAMKETQYLN